MREVMPLPKVEQPFPHALGGAVEQPFGFDGHGQPDQWHTVFAALFDVDGFGQLIGR